MFPSRTELCLVTPCTATPNIRSDQIMAPFKGAVLITEQQAFNEAMSARSVC